MKPLANQELYPLISFLFKKEKIDTDNYKYIRFFLPGFNKKSLSNNGIATGEEIKPISANDSGKDLWNTVSEDDSLFYLTRLSQKMSNKEKHYFLVLFLELSKQNNVFQSHLLKFIEDSAQQFRLESNILDMLKKIILVTFPSLSRSNSDASLMLLNERDLNDMSKINYSTNVPNDSQQVLAYACFTQEQIVIIKTSAEKSTINGNEIQEGMAYPLIEGDVLRINENQISFNELFHHYFSILPFPPLLVEATENTPVVNFDPRKNQLEIMGSSIPEDGIAFFLPMLKWVDSYLMTLPTHIEVKIRLDYFNTTSSKFILDIFKKLESYKKEHIALIVNWYFAYGDDDLEEAGLYYSEIVKIPFALIPYN